MQEIWQLYTDPFVLVTVIFPTLAALWGMVSCVVFRDWWIGPVLTGIVFSLLYLVNFGNGFWLWIVIYVAITTCAHLALQGLLIFINKYKD